MSPIEIIQADLSRPAHQRAVVALLNAYASDPMGDGKPLEQRVQRELIPGLQRHPTTLVFLAFRDEEAIGIATCFLGFSTFAARTLVNIHDLAVLPEYRGQGVGRQLLTAVEQKARDIGCCKLTLEVQENNHRAQGVYQKFGFAQSEYLEEAGGGLFFTKPLGN